MDQQKLEINLEKEEETILQRLEVPKRKSKE